jgi:YggT family protein
VRPHRAPSGEGPSTPPLGNHATLSPPPALGKAPSDVYISPTHRHREKTMALIYPIISVIELVLELYGWVLVASIVYSWLYQFGVVNQRNPIVAAIGDTLYRLTEPVLAPVRRMLPNFGALDLSPLVVFLAIYLIRQYLWILVR